MQRLVGLGARLLGIDFDEVGDAVHQRVLQSFLDGGIAPGEVHLALLGAFALEALRRLEQAIGGIRAPVQNHILDQLAKVRRNVVVDRELAGVDDPHVHAGLDRMVEKHRVHRLAHRLVAAERERQVRHAARDVHQGKAPLDLPRRLDEVDTVIVVLLDSRRDSEDVRIEDDILGRKPDFLSQQCVGPRADLDLAVLGVGLALLVEGHHDHCSPIAKAFLRLLEKLLLALLHRDRVDDRLALHAFQAGFDHRPLRAVDHHRHATDVRLRRDHVEERRHCLFRVEQALVHVHVDDLCAGLHLLPRHRQRRLVVALLDQLSEFRRSRDIGALADVDESRARGLRRHLFISLPHAAASTFNPPQTLPAPRGASSAPSRAPRAARILRRARRHGGCGRASSRSSRRRY